LYQHIVEAGYDTQAFAQYINYKKGKLNFYLSEDGINIDNWTYEGLIEVVEEFKQFQAQLILPEMSLADVPKDD
jgi:hypothetical protein